MKYKGLYISRCDDSGIEREINGVVSPCKGYFFQVYANPDYSCELDNFCGAFGIDMENDEISISGYIKSCVDKNELNYVEQLKSLGWGKDDIKSKINNLIFVEGNEVAYHALLPLDKEGFALYHAAKQLTDVNIYEHFYTEDCQGLFEEMDGFKLKKYLEAAYLGKCEYTVSGAYEFLVRYTIDYNTDYYKNYENDVFALTIKNLFEENKGFSLEEIQAVKNNLECLACKSFSYELLHPKEIVSYVLRPELIKDKLPHENDEDNEQDEDLEL